LLVSKQPHLSWSEHRTEHFAAENKNVRGIDKLSSRRPKMSNFRFRNKEPYVSIKGCLYRLGIEQVAKKPRSSDLVRIGGRPCLPERRIDACYANVGARQDGQLCEMQMSEELSCNDGGGR
jgi:hypothetical protein